VTGASIRRRPLRRVATLPVPNTSPVNITTP
jgi:hypothetical protein